MFTSKWRFAAAAMIGLGLALSSLTSPAHAGTGQSDDVTAVLATLRLTGQLTSADRSILAKYPEIADQIMDPDPAAVQTGNDVVKELPPPLAVQVQAAGVTRCGAWRDQWVRKPTALGRTFYKFHQYMSWCYNGASVTRIEQRYAYTSDESTYAYYEGLQTDTFNRPPAGEVNSYMKARIDNCIPKYGCISTSYPWARIRAGNNGSSIGTSGA